jgi:serine/threonine-protein kinase
MQQQLGHYQIEDLLGEGSFAWVYRAYDQKFEQYVALKLLKPIWLGDPQAIARFKQEARTARKLRHPHIVDVYDVGDAGGQVYMTQLLVKGETLADRLARDPMAWDEVVKVVTDIALALDHAHSEGIIHRDIKPANILLGSDNKAYLGDFGLVRAVEGSASLSTSGSMIGTGHYMAPEIWDGKEATPATDVYALSCVVFEMFTGEVLFEGSSMMAVLKKHAEGPKLPDTWPARVPDGVTDVLKRGLAEDPADRISSAGELASQLAVFSVSSEPVTTPFATSQTTASSSTIPAPESTEPAAAAQAGKKSSSRWLFIVGAAVVVLIIAAIAFFVLVGSSDSGDEVAAGPTPTEEPAEEVDTQATVEAAINATATKLAVAGQDEVDTEATVAAAIAATATEQAQADAHATLNALAATATTEAEVPDTPTPGPTDTPTVTPTDTLTPTMTLIPVIPTETPIPATPVESTPFASSSSCPEWFVTPEPGKWVLVLENHYDRAVSQCEAESSIGTCIIPAKHGDEPTRVTVQELPGYWVQPEPMAPSGELPRWLGFVEQESREAGQIKKEAGQIWAFPMFDYKAANVQQPTLYPLEIPGGCPYP